MALLDIALPGEDGYVVAKKLCGLLKRRPVLVALSGYHGLQERSEQEGFDHYYIKPVDPCKLADILSEYANKLVSELCE